MRTGLPGRWAVRRLIPDGADVRDPDVRARAGVVNCSVSVAVNLVLTLVKAVFAALTGSVSLLADAVHSVSDLLTSAVGIVGFRMGRKPPDARHPFGHGRMEVISALIIGVVLVLLAFEMLHASVDRMLHPRPIDVGWGLVLLLGLTIVIKELFARWTYELGRLLDSPVLRADAAHHRSDALTTVLVLAAFVGARYDVLWLDGVMGIGVAGFIGWAAADIMRRAVSPLIGEQASPAMIREIADVARSFPEVRGVHEVMVHRYGPTSVISVHIEAAADDPHRLHELSAAVEDRIVRRFPGHVVVHVDPLNLDHPRYDEVRRKVGEAVDGESLADTFHDLRLLGGVERFRVVFDIVPRERLAGPELEDLRERICERVRRSLPDAEVVVRADSPFFKDVPPSGGPGASAAEGPGGRGDEGSRGGGS